MKDYSDLELVLWSLSENVCKYLEKYNIGREFLILFYTMMNSKGFLIQKGVILSFYFSG